MLVLVLIARLLDVSGNRHRLPEAAVAPVISRVRVIVSGRVQDVWFRDTCRRVAVHEGVSGFVRNLSDGTVEAAFEGDPDAVERLVEWCRRGPRLAKVSGVNTVTEAPRGDATFEIR